MICVMPCLLSCGMVVGLFVLIVAMCGMMLLGGVPALIVLCGSAPILGALFSGSTMVAIITAILSPLALGGEGLAGIATTIAAILGG